MKNNLGDYDDSLLWHYTAAKPHLDNIIKDKLLKVSHVEKKLGEKATLWFSKDQMWEPTSIKVPKGLVTYKGIEGLFFQHMFCGAGRVGVKFSDFNFTSWEKYKKLTPNNAREHIWMENVAEKALAKWENWFCVYHDIPFNKWRKVQKFDGKIWVDVLIS